jgi:hypothetical protein
LNQPLPAAPGVEIGKFPLAGDRINSASAIRWSRTSGLYSNAKK